MCKTRTPEAEQVAAIEIQRFWRGSRVRFKIRALFESLLTELRAPSNQVLQSDSSVSGQVHLSSSTTPAEAEQLGTSSVKSGSRRKARKSRKVSQPVGLQREKKGQAETETAGKAPESPAAGGKGRSSLVQPETEKAGKAPESPAASWKARDSLFLHTASVKKKRGSYPRAAGERPRKRDLKERDVLEEQSGSLLSGEREVPVKSQRMTKKSAPRLALEAAYDRYVQKALEKGVASTHMLQFAEYCAHKIQVWWLMRHRRFMRERFIQRLVELQKQAAVESAAAMEAMIQGASISVQKKKRDRPPTEREAAISIQRAWRRHIDIQVYRYYRDLINFKTRGNPSVMLRCINPNEAKLLDPASGTSVRFRLAGDRFPPNIYYKIFTHRPIQDMGANSPKDYTKAQAKQLNVRHRHNNVAPIPPQQDDKGGWYERFENNGWRLVSDRLIHHILNDPITWESSKKTYQFDHSKLKRKQDVEKQKKTKKIEWMKKMYKQGMLRARADDQETVQLIEGAAAGMMATVDNQGPDALEDWEVDELLDWTTSLNFEEYFNTWKDLATSAAADNQLEKTMSIGTSKSDPYELTVSTAPSRFQSTRQSRHTTATLTSGSIHVKT